MSEPRQPDQTRLAGGDDPHRPVLIPIPSARPRNPAWTAQPDRHHPRFDQPRGQRGGDRRGGGNRAHQQFQPKHAASSNQGPSHYSNGRPRQMFSALQRENGTAKEVQAVGPDSSTRSGLKAGRAAPNLIDLTAEDGPNSPICLDSGPDRPAGSGSGPAVPGPVFGAPSPHTFVSSEQVTRDIKSLLSRGFGDDDDDDGSKLRLPRPMQRDRGKSKDGRPAGSLGENDSPSKHDDEENDDEIEDGTVDRLVIKLLPHQVTGVAWMIERENGTAAKGAVLSRGGILADDMGLGKTVQTISLILLNRPTPIAGQPADSNRRSTLIVAPLALIKQWEHEIQTKVDPASPLSVLVHHGPNRTKSGKGLAAYDVVITTYQILASELASSADLSRGPNVGCFGVNWFRVVLDEAHNIKNRSAKCSQAAYALSSEYRWCLSGTPMQNSLDELQSLIRFLRIRPYCEYGNWKTQILSPVKNGQAGVAIPRLRLFLNEIMKRRTKDVLRKEGALSFGGARPSAGSSTTPTSSSSGFKIQPRTIELVKVELNERERTFYDRLADRAQDRLESMMGEKKQDYIGALVLLLRLRQACNHPQLVGGNLGVESETAQPSSRSTQDKSKRPDKNKGSGDVDDIADLLGGLSVTRHKCDICQIELSSSRTEAGLGHCPECLADLDAGLRHKTDKKDGRTETRPPVSRRQQLVIDSDDDVDKFEPTVVELSSDSDSDSDSCGSSSDVGGRITSSKITRLLEIIQTEISINKHKMIIFSEFTTMLDLIAPFLSDLSHSFVRYDGRMRNDAREASLAALRTDPATSILLCSLKCGSLGLNLTAACRVVLMEPFWNPFAESQAIDRVHRLNQTKPVHVYRLTASNTVEERILRLQDAKQALADVALEGEKAGSTMNKLSFDDILRLFGRNGGGAASVTTSTVADLRLPTVSIHESGDDVDDTDSDGYSDSDDDD